MSIIFDAEPPAFAASAATRWAALVTRNIECPVDPRTLSIWGRFVGASVPMLRSRCVAIGVGTKASLDFTRMLRAVVRALRARSDPVLEFDVCDPRTIRRLFERGGLGDPYSYSSLPPVGQFLAAQRLISHRVALQCVAAQLVARGDLEL